MPARTDDPPFRRIGVVGLGLIGGSIALAVRRAWAHVEIIGIDRPNVADSARGSGIVDATGSSAAEIAAVDLIVLATPVPEIIEEIAVLGRAGVGAVVSDVGSTKRQVMAAAVAAGLKRFVGGHPIAGSERGGLSHARADLFDGRTWALVGGDRAPLVESFIAALGARPRHTDAESHDRAMAFVSHAPQVIASALMAASGQGVGRAGLDWSGQGFADMTRIASSPAAVWEGILATNADFIAEAIGAVLSQLPATSRDLSDHSRIQRLFADAAHWRGQRFPS